MRTELAVVHEAGHAVMQWFVGWDLKGLQMKVQESNATDVGCRCPSPSLNTTSDIRKRLLVLLAGQAATKRDWPESWNNRRDWDFVLLALSRFFQRPTELDGALYPTDPVARVLVETADRKCAEIVAHCSIRRAIDTVAEAFAACKAEESGVVCLSALDAVRICESVVGSKFRLDNPWSDWIAGM
jgi:hypothetical protein